MAIKMKKKKKGLKVDFTGTDVRVLVPEGNYHAKVKEVTLEDGQQAQYLKWVFELIDADEKVNGQKVYTNTSLAPQALWNLRNLLETMGVETPDDEMELELEEYVGLELIVRIEHEDFEGKMRTRVTDYMPLQESAESEEDEASDDEEEEETPPPKKTKKEEKTGKKKPEPEPEEEEDEEEESEEEAEEESDEEEEESEDDDESGEDSEDEEEESEEEEEAAEGISADDVREMDDKELAALVKEHQLPVKLKAIPKASKRIAAVIDALEKAGLLAE